MDHHTPWVDEEVFAAVTAPIMTANSRVAGGAVHRPARANPTLLHALSCSACCNGFFDADPRARVAALDGLPPATTAGRMSYHLRRLRGARARRRIPGSHRYHVAEQGLRVALFFIRAHDRLLRTGPAYIDDPSPPASSPLRSAFRTVEAALDREVTRSRLAA